MTAGASRLTERATRGAIDAAVGPMQPASHLRAFVDALGRLGYDVAPLLAEVSLRRVDLDDPDAMLPCSATEVIVRGAQRQRQMPNLWARMGQATPIGSFPLLDYLVVTSDTIGDALRQLGRWLHLTSAPCACRVDHGVDVARLVIEPGEVAPVAQFETSIIIHHLRQETEPPLRVLAVSLMSSPDDVADLERLLGCRVRAPATWSGIELPREALRLPLRRREPALRHMLEGHAATLDAPVVVADASVAAQIRGVIAARLDRGLPRLGAVARALTMSPRTLQRRLAAEGVSYEALADVVRREAAERLLADAALAISEIGYLLGFSEPSAFHRAFRRWHDMTPAEFRARIRLS